MSEIVGSCSGVFPHTYEAWPIHISPAKVERTLQIESKLDSFLQIVVSAACAKTDSSLWKITANGRNNRDPSAAKARSWISFFLMFHPDAKLSTTQIGAVLNRHHTTVLFYRNKLLDCLADKRFGKDAYALRHIAQRLEDAGFSPFDMNPYVGVKRLVGIRGQEEEGAAA